MKRLLFILCASVLLFSCKKEYSYEGGPVKTSEYYITGNIGGTDREFIYDTQASYTMNAGLNILELTAFESADPGDNTNITLGIFYDPTTAPAPGVGTYDYQSDDYFPVAFYDFNDQNTRYTAGVDNTGDLTITITSITNEVVEGTFSGTFYATDNSGNIDHTNSIVITNGKFRLPFP